MIASAVRLRQVSPVSSLQSDAVTRSGSARFPRKVKLPAWSKPLMRSANPKASEVCSREMSVAPPAIFQLECWERHSCEMVPRIFPPNASVSNCNPTRWFPSRDKRSEEHTSELQSLAYLVCRLLLAKK